MEMAAALNAAAANGVPVRPRESSYQKIQKWVFAEHTNPGKHDEGPEPIPECIICYGEMSMPVIKPSTATGTGTATTNPEGDTAPKPAGVLFCGHMAHLDCIEEYLHIEATKEHVGTVTDEDGYEFKFPTPAYLPGCPYCRRVAEPSFCSHFVFSRFPTPEERQIHLSHPCYSAGSPRLLPKLQIASPRQLEENTSSGPHQCNLCNEVELLSRGLKYIGAYGGTVFESTPLLPHVVQEEANRITTRLKAISELQEYKFVRRLQYREYPGGIDQYFADMHHRKLERELQREFLGSDDDDDSSDISDDDSSDENISDEDISDDNSSDDDISDDDTWDDDVDNVDDMDLDDNFYERMGLMGAAFINENLDGDENLIDENLDGREIDPDVDDPDTVMEVDGQETIVPAPAPAVAAGTGRSVGRTEDDRMGDPAFWREIARHITSPLTQGGNRPRVAEDLIDLDEGMNEE